MKFSYWVQNIFIFFIFLIDNEKTKKTWSLGLHGWAPHQARQGTAQPPTPSSRSRGPLGTRPPQPKISSKSCSFQEILREKPYFKQILDSGPSPSGVKTPLGPPAQSPGSEPAPPPKKTNFVFLFVWLLSAGLAKETGWHLLAIPEAVSIRCKSTPAPWHRPPPKLAGAGESWGRVSPAAPVHHHTLSLTLFPMRP